MLYNSLEFAIFLPIMFICVAIHLTGLNRLRALAALSVVIGHTFQDTFGDWGFIGLDFPIFKGGVTLFFVISGFLITYLLLQEMKKINDIKIGAYRMLDINLPIWLQSSIIYIYTIVATIIVANLSYNYVEKPFLKFKNKFAIVRSQTSIKK